MSNSASRSSKNRHRRSRSDPTTSVLGSCVPIRCDIDARMTCSQTNKPDPNGFCKLNSLTLSFLSVIFFG